MSCSTAASKSGRVAQVALAGIPVVHVDHARIGVVGVVGLVIGTAAVAWMGALGAQFHVVADHGLGLVGREYLRHDEVALIAVGLDLGGVEVHGGLLPECDVTHCRGRFETAPYSA